MNHNDDKRWVIDVLIRALQENGKPFPKTCGALIADEDLDAMISTLRKLFA